ncbi:MAG: FAD-dependent thymidylate synthase, partial [Acidobacteria bacterium]|nr:FAD-dependent thymidylate synthase [Acidobacteriota bacterium]
IFAILAKIAKVQYLATIGVHSWLNFYEHQTCPKASSEARRSANRICR